MNIEDLIGKWKITREITDPGGMPKGRMEGHGFFDLYEGKQLLYHEQLWHETERGEIFCASKFYRYHFRDDQIAIYFYKEEGNRLFMTLLRDRSLLKGHATCQDDAYSLKWDWIGPESFFTCYRATGPKKNTVIESEFRR